MASPPSDAGQLIELIVQAARLPWRRQREELRRELWTHFEDTCGEGDD